MRSKEEVDPSQMARREKERLYGTNEPRVVVHPCNPVLTPSSTPDLSKIQRFCNRRGQPCDNFTPPQTCAALPSPEGLIDRVTKGICWEAHVDGRSGAMTKLGFQPDRF